MVTEVWKQIIIEKLSGAGGTMTFGALLKELPIKQGNEKEEDIIQDILLSMANEGTLEMSQAADYLESTVELTPKT